MGISLKTPPYGDEHIKEKTRVFVELVKPSDDSTSEPQEFFYVPSDTGTSQTIAPIKNKEAEMAGGFKNLYNIGNCVTEIKKEKLRIKQEHIDGWSSAKVQPRQQPLFQNNLNIQQQMMNNQTQSYQTKNIGINQNTNAQSSDYVPNIPPNYLTQMTNPYITSQQSPESQGLSELNITSPYEPQVAHDLVCFDKDVQNLSGKIESFSLSDAIEASLNMQVHAADQRSGGKRSSRTAKLESGSNIVPREIARLHVSNSIDTPNNSGQINTPCDSATLASFLTNCRQMNDL